MGMLRRCLPLLVLFCPFSIGGQPSVTKLHVTSRIQLRYASTQVVSHVTNPSPEAQEVKFEIRLPEKAFIHNFSMTVDGHEYIATVEEKEQAQKTYEDAREVGIGAGLVSRRRQTEDTTTFSIATNVPGNQEAVFKLEYDELLKRDKGWYEHTVHLDLEDTVPNLRVEVFIDETLPLAAVTVPLPQLLIDNQINPVDLRQELEQQGEKTDWEKGLSHILFSPSTAEQEEARSKNNSGKFSVNYQVTMDPDGEVQVIDGYFVHYNEDATGLDSLPKYTVFVLDVSGSMRGEKIQQLQDTMFTVLNEMNSTDFFSIITFNSSVMVWTSNEVDPIHKSLVGPADVMAANENNKKVAIAFTNSLVASGSTDINSAMLKGVDMAAERMATMGRLRLLNSSSLAMVVFLTDGQAVSGETDATKIKENIQGANWSERPIYSIAFGADADFALLKEISAESEAWSKRIYEGADAALQLENFYKEISSPVIKKLKFKYVGVPKTESEVMNEEVKTVFKGSSFAHVAKIPEDLAMFQIQLQGQKKGERTKTSLLICLHPDQVPALLAPTCRQPSARKPRSPVQGFMQKLHAYVHIRKLVERGNKGSQPGQQSDEQRALALALENSFVTSLTSLVVTTAQNTTTLASLSDVVDQEFSDRTTVVRSPVPSGPNYPRGRRPGSTTTSTTTTEPPSTPASARCEGSITLWSSTYLRGESVTISTRDIEDLADLSFDDKLVSLSVSGCCWTLYSEPLFMGEEQVFRPGDYKGVASVGRLFREASSVRQTPWRC